MKSFNWESLVGAALAASMFGMAYEQASPEPFYWWVPLLFGVGMAMMRNR